jgi:4-carboxymuconolactone decarboxylase
VAVYRDERSPEHPRYSKRLIESYHQTGLDRNLPQLERIYGLDPDWCELFMQFIRGGLYSREVLSQATREIIACGALACLDKQEQLRSHLQTGVAFGAPKEHLLEAIFQSVVYGGFPATHNSLKTFSELFPDMVKHDRPAVPASDGELPRGPVYEPAYENAVMMYGQEYADGIVERFNGWDPDFALLAQRFVFGGIYARRVVDPKLRQLITIGCLTVRNAMQQLETHLRVALRLGIPPAEIQEVIFQMSAYCGFPYVVVARRIFDGVLATWPVEQGS